MLPLEDICLDIQSEVEAMLERQDIVTGGCCCAVLCCCVRKSESASAVHDAKTHGVWKATDRVGRPGKHLEDSWRLLLQGVRYWRYN